MPAGDQLNKEDAERVNVALLGELVGSEILRIYVPCCALDLRGDVRGVRVLGAQPRESEVSHLGPERLGK